MATGPEKTTVEFTAKAEVMGIGGGVKVARDYKGDSPMNRPLGEQISRFFFGASTESLVPDLREEELLTSLKGRASLFNVEQNIEQYRVDSYWNSLDLQPFVTSIVSGKGGVGKSTIALGLTEAFSKTENVLLVDFDLHNRGLTSKYRGLKPGMSSVLDELRRFRELISTAELPREGSNLVLSDIKTDTFHKLRHDFCYPAGDNKQSPLGLVPLYQASVSDNGASDWPENQRPGNCYFLPSRLPGSIFLGMPESRLDAAEVALCITFLAHRARQQSQTINRVVVDCHGAHDMFMVGAILASEQTVIVSKPEESAFEGTIELMRFAQSAVEAKNAYPRAQTLVFNELHTAEKRVARLLFELYYGETNSIKFEDIPSIPSTDVIRDELRFYDRPMLLSNVDLRQAILKIVDAGKKASRKSA